MDNENIIYKISRILSSGKATSIGFRRLQNSTSKDVIVDEMVAVVRHTDEVMVRLLDIEDAESVGIALTQLERRLPEPEHILADDRTYEPIHGATEPRGGSAL